MGAKRVLLVDDELFFWGVMKRNLESWGYEALWASSGKEALDKVSKEGCDIVILDYKMPDMDGIATLEEIRRISRGIPVIMFTAYPDKKSLNVSQELNVAAFIPKTSEYADMHLALKATLDEISSK